MLMGMGNEAYIFLVMDKHQEVQGVWILIREDYPTCEKPFQLWNSLDLDHWICIGATCFIDGLSCPFQSLWKLEEADIFKIWLWNSLL